MNGKYANHITIETVLEKPYNWVVVEVFSFMRLKDETSQSYFTILQSSQFIYDAEEAKDYISYFSMIKN